MSDELERLNKLYKEGTLNDEEFTQAKRRLLNQQDDRLPAPVRDQLPRESADRDFVFPIVMLVVVVFLVVIFFVGVGPHWHHWHWDR